MLFVSAASTFRDRVAGILLTGGGSDGAHGLVTIKEQGGLSIVQRPSEAADPTMPLTGIREDSVDYVASLEELPSLLTALASGEPIIFGTMRPRTVGRGKDKKPVDADKTIARFLKASTDLEQYLHGDGPLTPLHQQTIETTILGLRTMMDSWARKNRAEPTILSQLTSRKAQGS